MRPNSNFPIFADIIMLTPLGITIETQNQQGQNCTLFKDAWRPLKPIPYWAAHTCLTQIWGYPSPPGEQTTTCTRVLQSACSWADCVIVLSPRVLIVTAQGSKLKKSSSRLLATNWRKIVARCKVLVTSL